MAVSAHDIRMREFKRATLRGYDTTDVDTFLMYLAVEMDRRERQYRAMALDHRAARAKVPAAEAPIDPPAEPVDAPAEPVDDADPVDLELDADDIVEDARLRAERGLARAKAHARQIVDEAQERKQAAERAEAEARLRLAHLEQRLTDRARVLAEEAERLDQIVARLTEQDLAPDLSEYHSPAHAAPSEDADVVQLARTADD